MDGDEVTMLDRWTDDVSNIDDDDHDMIPRWCIGSQSSFHDQNPSSGI